VAHQLLILLVKALMPSGAPVVIGLDDTIERRWGAKISARGIYRDPVSSSKGHFVKASGLRWLSAMLLVKVPWADRVMALLFLTLLAPSKMPIIFDQVGHLAFPDETLDERHIDNIGRPFLPAANDANAIGVDIEKRAEPRDPLIQQLLTMHQD
jgi:hypothetical protein